ncbi:hypothetical protein NO2_0207 [Candidatus Termititenax persephonae]|uniref:Uncharacterized protein n=1 Tax=Candidatus Termititenax persephonae TaxID=2218525 RepID=A0A388TFB4_9BACT|nr:hypothetical protein NO2_0207 [Candidatus Termititenax persephonae]
MMYNHLMWRRHFKTPIYSPEQGGLSKILAKLRRAGSVLLLCPLLLFFLLGCARVVTDKSLTDPSTGQTLTVTEAQFTFTFASPPAQNPGQNYYLILAADPLTEPVNKVHPYDVGSGGGKYFASPEAADLVSTNQNLRNTYFNGQTAEEINLDDIYAAHFNHWRQYYLYNHSGPQRLYQAPFVSANVPSLTVINHPAPRVSGGVLYWTISLPPGLRNFYFALVAVQDERKYTDSVIEESQIGVNAQRHLSRAPSNPAIQAYTVDLVEY